MEIPSWLQDRLSKNDKSKIERAVAKAEEKTTGEIVPMVVSRSSHITDVPLLLSAILVALGLLVLNVLHSLGILNLDLYATAAVLIVAVLMGQLLARIPDIQRLLISKEDRQHQVQLRAELEFFEAGLQKTDNKTGILLFVSLLERRAVVLADKGITNKLPQETWVEVVKLLLEGIKSGDMAEGYIQAINACGKILEEHFPIDSNDRNELHDTFVIKE